MAFCSQWGTRSTVRHQGPNGKLRWPNSTSRLGTYAFTYAFKGQITLALRNISTARSPQP